LTSYVVFTDLDGTLLDADDFNYGPAEPVIRRLREKDIPLIIVTSKTFAEVEALAGELQIEGPIVVESGGAIALQSAAGQWEQIPLGMRAGEIRRLIPAIEHASGARLLLYTSMTDVEAELVSGLSGDALRRSLQREFDEPFLLARGEIADVAAAADKLGLTVRQGGRFHHLTGRSGKGDAVRHIIASFEDRPLTIALGDAPMDAEFLELADIPIIVRERDGRPNERLLSLVPYATIAPDSGPYGWARALEQLLDCRPGDNDAYGAN
jgi:mannosyl-3-phosphoglycerate phosphatase